MTKVTGTVPVAGGLMPGLGPFADPANPGTARMVSPDDAAATLGPGYRLRAITAEGVPNGFWPLDFGGALGEPVTRGVSARLPWLAGSGGAAAPALRAADLPVTDPIDAPEPFPPPSSPTPQLV